MGFPGSAVAKNLPAKAGDIGDVGLIPWAGISSGRKWQPTPVLLPGKFHRQRSLGRGVGVGWEGWSMATVHGIAKSWTQLSMHASKNILISDLCQCVI